MTVKEKIFSTLKNEDRRLTASDLAEIINDKTIKPFEVDSIARLNPEIFSIDSGISKFGIKNNKIALVEWGNDKDISKLAQRIIDIIEAYEEETPIIIILDAIKELYDEFPDTTEKDVRNEIENNPEFVIEKNDNVSLKEWNLSFEIRKMVIEQNLPMLEDDGKEITTNIIKENPIKTFSIANFKAYKDLQHFKIKPITLLFGPNSSGKSSFIHSLLYFSNALSKNNLSPNYMEISGDSVDLGGFKQLIYKRDYKNKLQFKIELNKNKLNKNLSDIFKNVEHIIINIEISQPLKHTKKNIEVDKGYLELPGIEIPDGEPVISKYEIVTDSIPLLNIKSTSIFILDSLNYNNEIIKSFVEKSLKDEKVIDTITLDKVVQIGLSELLVKLYAKTNSFIPKNLFYKELHLEKIYSDSIAPIELDDNKTKLKQSLILYFPTLLNELLSDVYDLLDSQFSELKYLGPMRSYPPRHLLSDNDISSFDPNYFSGGEFAWHRLREDEKLREKINVWLSSEKLKAKYKLEKRTLVDIESKKVNELVFQAEYNVIAEQEGNWSEKILETIEKNAKAIGAVDDLVLIDQNSNTVVSHKDVGFGISQVIPVLVSAYDNKNKTVLIEQPEIHLHPKLQSKLADTFVENAIGENKNTFILETHSEHLLRKLQVLVAKGELKREDLAIYYIDRIDGVTKVKEMEIEKNGFFKEPWPDGFFDESYDLTEQLLLATRKS